MPVKRTTVGLGSATPPAALVAELIAELTAQREFGQPVVEVETFQRTGLAGITVTWDKWDRIPDAQRTAVILEAFTRAFGDPGPDNVAFAVGLTTEEAVAAGKFPYAILPLIRDSDGISADRVREVMVEFGGTPTPDSDLPAVLRFSSREDAEACRARLTARLPGSDPIWTITQDVHRPDW